MAKVKQIEALVVHESGAFTGQVAVNRYSGATRVLCARSGFATEAAAHEWTSHQLGERRARDAEARAKQMARNRRQREMQRAAATLSLRALAELYPDTPGLKHRIELLWQEVAFRAWKTDGDENRAIRIANESVGRRWTQRLSNALDGKRDVISDWAGLQAVANARRLETWS